MIIGILASGRGSNFQAIIDDIKSGRLDAEVAVLITDNPSAYAIERAKVINLEYKIVTPDEYDTRDAYYERISQELKHRNVQLVVLAGFMRIIGKPLIEAFPNSIMNIHPALLPSFPGLHGQGQATAYGVKISGCTVHFVDEGVDTGPIIIQAAVPVWPGDTEEALSERILELEHQIYPEAIRLFAEKRIHVAGRVVKIDGYHEQKGNLVNPPLGQ